MNEKDEVPANEREFSMDSYVPGSLSMETIKKYDRRKDGKYQTGDEIPDFSLYDLHQKGREHSYR
jgi:hypothetical protein